MQEFNDIVFNGSGSELMDPLVTETIDQRNMARKGTDSRDVI